MFFYTRKYKSNSQIEDGVLAIKIIFVMCKSFICNCSYISRTNGFENCINLRLEGHYSLYINSKDFTVGVDNKREWLVLKQ